MSCHLKKKYTCIICINLRVRVNCSLTEGVRMPFQTFPAHFNPCREGVENELTVECVFGLKSQIWLPYHIYIMFCFPEVNIGLFLHHFSLKHWSLGIKRGTKSCPAAQAASAWLCFWSKQLDGRQHDTLLLAPTKKYLFCKHISLKLPLLLKRISLITHILYMARLVTL